MPRPIAEITKDLDSIRSTLQALHAGFNSAKPIAEVKLGAPTAHVLFGIVGNIFGVHETMARVLIEIVERQTELETNQAKIVDGIGETARQLQ